MTGFSSLNTAVTGLYAAQRAMDVTGQNIVNANTPGYSRQRVALAEIGSATSSSLFTGDGADNGGRERGRRGADQGRFVEGARVAAGAPAGGADQPDRRPDRRPAAARRARRDRPAVDHRRLLRGLARPREQPDGRRRGLRRDPARDLGHRPAARPQQRHRRAVVDRPRRARGRASRRPTRRPRTSPTSTARSPPGSSPAGRSTSSMDQRDTLARTLGTLVGGQASQGAGRPGVGLGRRRRAGVGVDGPAVHARRCHDARGRDRRHRPSSCGGRRRCRSTRAPPPGTWPCSAPTSPRSRPASTASPPRCATS